MQSQHKYCLMKYITPQEVEKLASDVSIIVNRVLLNNARVRIELTNPVDVNVQAIRSLYRACMDLYSEELVHLPCFGAEMKVGEVRSIFKEQWRLLPSNSFALAPKPI